ncbi:MAG: hypothetical protein ACT4PW_12555 [Acidimicrobiia bacterium]
MLSATHRLLLFYLGFGYVVLFGWAALAADVLYAPTPEARRRPERIGRLLVLAGLAHPALVLAGRDIIRQARQADAGPEDGPASATATGKVDAALAASLTVAGVVLALLH